MVATESQTATSISCEHRELESGVFLRPLFNISCCGNQQRNDARELDVCGDYDCEFEFER